MLRDAFGNQQVKELTQLAESLFPLGSYNSASAATGKTAASPGPLLAQVAPLPAAQVAQLLPQGGAALPRQGMLRPSARCGIICRTELATKAARVQCMTMALEGAAAEWMVSPTMTMRQSLEALTNS